MTTRSSLSSKSLIPVTLIERRIYLIRGHKVMIDTDLAQLYGVPTYRLNEAVKRNRRRFPSDFMFQLSKKEAESLTSQFAISTKGRGGRRTLPYAFTAQGVNTLGSRKDVLASDGGKQSINELTWVSNSDARRKAWKRGQ